MCFEWGSISQTEPRMLIFIEDALLPHCARPAPGRKSSKTGNEEEDRLKERFWVVRCSNGSANWGLRCQRNGMKRIHAQLNTWSHEPINRSIMKTYKIEESVNRWRNEAMNQCIKRWSNQSINRSITQSINHPTNQSINQSIKQSHPFLFIRFNL